MHEHFLADTGNEAEFSKGIVLFWRAPRFEFDAGPASCRGGTVNSTRSLAVTRAPLQMPVAAPKIYPLVALGGRQLLT
jgi:hypothetical protein